MSKPSIISRSVEARVIDRPTNRAADILEQLFSQKGPCEQCVFYRDQPGLYCLRYGECFPETRVEWRGRVEGVRYGPQDTRHILGKS